MLERAVAVLKADKNMDQIYFSSNNGGFKNRDL